MKIANATIELNSQRHFVEKHTLQTSLKVWVGNQRPDFEGTETTAARPRGDLLTLSEQARTKMMAEKNTDTQTIDKTAEDEFDGEPRLVLLKRMVESMTGEAISLNSFKLEAKTPHGITTEPATSPLPSSAQRAGFGIEYEHHEYYSEAETTTVSAEGSVNTQDGRKVQFKLQLNMQRAFASQQDISLRLGDAKKIDPLVLNFDGNAAQLTDTRFSFDLNADGSEERIAFLAGNSGFLVFDKNNDGTINNGGELFGPTSGDGFAELTAYDEDHNQWIDENDAVFDKLQLWTKNADGQDQLSSLTEKKVGAIYLGQVSSEFALKNQQNQLQGQVRSSGVYLTEAGHAGIMQQIDLVV